MNKRLQVATMLAASKDFPEWNTRKEPHLMGQQRQWAKTMLDFADVLIDEEEASRGDYNG